MGAAERGLEEGVGGERMGLSEGGGEEVGWEGGQALGGQGGWLSEGEGVCGVLEIRNLQLLEFYSCSSSVSFITHAGTWWARRLAV